MSGDGIGKKPVLPVDFENFEELSQAYFDECTRKKMKKELEALECIRGRAGADDGTGRGDEPELLCRYDKAGKGNGRYTWLEALERKRSRALFRSYMDSMMEDADMMKTNWKIVKSDAEGTGDYFGRRLIHG